MLINKKVTDNLNRDLYFQVDELLPCSYYLIELKSKSENCPHYSIMTTQEYKEGGIWILDKTVELYCTGYEDKIIKIDFTKLFWFRIAKTIHEPEHIQNKRIILENYEQLQQNWDFIMKNVVKRWINEINIIPCKVCGGRDFKDNCIDKMDYIEL